MTRIVLVHGSCHGAWCWRDVLPPLRAAGHDAVAIDLPSHGEDRTPLAEVTLDAYARAILAAIGPEPAVVVGHSMAGYPISLAAEMEPQKVRKLLYLCAYLPVNGMSLVEMRQAAPRQPLLPAVRRSADGVSFTIDPAMAPEVFYHDCPPEAVAYAVPRLCAQAILPQATPVTLGGRFASVPKHYILCEDDRTIPPEYQATMVADWPEARVTRLPTSHSPFFSAPGRLAGLIAQLAETE